MVLDKTGEYQPIDVNKMYTLSSTDYILLHYGDGYKMFENASIIYYNEDAKDIEILVSYLHYLNGDLSMYQETENRINIY